MQESVQITHGFNPQSRSRNKSEIDDVGRSVPVRKSVMCASPASLRSQPPGAARRENRRKNSLQLLILARTRRKVQSWPPHGKRPNPELCAGPHEEKKIRGEKIPPRWQNLVLKHTFGSVEQSGAVSQRDATRDHFHGKTGVQGKMPGIPARRSGGDPDGHNSSEPDYGPRMTCLLPAACLHSHICSRHGHGGAVHAAGS